MESFEYDVFVSYAGEDRETLVRPLVEQLTARGFKVWYDRWELRVGQSISQGISSALNDSRFGIVVLSPNYFAKHWPKVELNSLIASEAHYGSRLLPIWFNVGFSDVLRESPLLADRVAVDASRGLGFLLDEIGNVLQTPKDRLGSSTSPTEGITIVEESSITLQSIEQLTKALFPTLQIDAFWQGRLMRDLDASRYKGIEELRKSILRGLPAAEAFSKKRPGLFRSGTDYVTKSLGFVDKDFRSRHNWSSETVDAFRTYRSLVRSID